MWSWSLLLSRYGARCSTVLCRLSVTPSSGSRIAPSTATSIVGSPLGSGTDGISGITVPPDGSVVSWLTIPSAEPSGSRRPPLISASIGPPGLLMFRWKPIVFPGWQVVQPVATTVIEGGEGGTGPKAGISSVDTDVVGA